MAFGKGLLSDPFLKTETDLTHDCSPQPHRLFRNMAVMTSNSILSKLRAASLEDQIRTALDTGELSTVVEAQIKSLSATGDLSEQEQTLLQILHDAIQDGCIRINPAH